VLYCVQVAALRRADPPSKESYRQCNLPQLINKVPINTYLAQAFQLQPLIDSLGHSGWNILEKNGKAPGIKHPLF
jgi:hypothetical protein